MNWVERFPERLSFEIADFDRRGLAFVLNERALREERRVELQGLIEVEGEAAPVELIVRYPSGFPLFRPEVYAPKLRLPRHQNPIDFNLCLLDRSTRAWSPSETAAHLISEQVPRLIQLVRVGGDALREGEVPQGEPRSYYFPGLAGTVVLIPEELLQISASFRSGTGRLAFSQVEPGAILIRGLLQSASVRERRGRSRRVAEVQGPLAERFSGGRSIEIDWVRIDELPDERSEQSLLKVAEETAPGSTRPVWQQVTGGQVAVTGLLFNEEVHQGVFGDMWLFVVRVREGVGRSVREGIYRMRGERHGIDDLQARIPQLAPLRQRTVALIGLGALGAPLALELARSGVGELRILDGDLVEAGTTVRWPFGISAINAPKSDFLAQVLPREYPFTRVIPFTRHLGLVALGPEETDHDLLTRMLEGADLVIDASAEIAVQQFVGGIADSMQIPQLYLWATEGARGGVVARSFPGETGCWFCLQLGFDRATIPLPPFEETGTVQPRGCASRTFTGASYDLTPIHAQGMRVAASLLGLGRREGEDDVFICSLEGGLSPGAPLWQARPLAREEGCPCCGAEQAAA
ncbi:MAG: ThiF family adenylyltransferase [Gaiellaceae bacterium]